MTPQYFQDRIAVSRGSRERRSANTLCKTVGNLRRLAVAKEDLAIIGVGGNATAEDVKEFLGAGATCTQACTTAMLNPFLAAEITKQLRTEGYSQSHSRTFDRSGLNVPFTDGSTAIAFDLTVEVCAELDVPFEVGFETLQKNWLNGYLEEMRTLQQASAVVKTRRQAPNKNKILEWVRSETFKKSK